MTHVASQNLATGARRCAKLAAPAILFTILFYWKGLTTWFQADDFAWMSQWIEVHNARDLLAALFEPRAQGSIRPWSERAFFLGLQALFGWNPLPFRLVVFATQALNLALLASVTLRITGSRLAAGLAALFWAASTALAVPMMWSSVYNQILCAAFFLAGFRAWIAYCDEDAKHWLWLQWFIFVLGFGALETMVMYPVLVMSWTPGWRRWKVWLPLFGVSGLYTLLHQWVSPAPKEGPYALHIDGSLFTTLVEYLRQVFGGPLLGSLPVSAWLRMLGQSTPLLLGLPILWFAMRRRDGRMLVPLAFLLAPLIPMLPLRDHITHYYLVTPAAGLALALAWCCADLAKRPRAGTLVAVAMAAVFLGTSMVAAARNRDFWFDRGEGVRTLMLGLVHARKLHPAQTLVVAGVDGQKFYASLGEDAARALDLGLVYLAPGSHKNIDAQPGEPDPTSFELDEPVLSRGLAEGNVLIYAPAGEHLRNVSSIYRALDQASQDGAAALTGRVEPASPLYAAQLGTGWLATGGAARWMGARATAFVAGKAGTKKLIVEGYCPRVQFSAGPFQIRAVLNDTTLGQSSVAPPEGIFRLEFQVPQDIVATTKWEVTLEAYHTSALPDGSHASVLISAIFLQPL